MQVQYDVHLSETHHIKKKEVPRAPLGWLCNYYHLWIIFLICYVK
jgi:hypothetical protein